jgi:hypothetical protein
MDLSRDLAEILGQIKQASDCFELSQVTTFIGYRKRKPDGEVHKVTIEVWDAGPGTVQRYMVVATDEDGRQASGNPFDRLDLTLDMVHWFDLDRD